MTSTTRNRGRAETGAFRVGLYLSPNETITTDDELLGSCLVLSLGSGSVTSCDRTVTIPPSLTPGMYFVGVIADDQDDLDEANEANNARSATHAMVAEIDEPDLAVTTLTAPASGTAGGTISVTSTTRNQGTGVAGAFRVGVYLSTNTTITMDDLLLDSCSFASLGVSGTADCDRSVTIPGTVTPGTYYVGAVADDRSSVPESNETNNSLSATNATVVSARPMIDLAVMEISAPTRGTVGGTIAVTSRTENVGSAAAAAFRVGLYLSTDATVTTTGQEIGSCSVSALAVGESAACNIDVTIPASVAPGTYYVGAYADDQDVVTESEEANNSLAASNPTGLDVAAADLVVVDVTAPATGTIGGTVQITSSTENLGGTEAGAFRIALYLSTDATITTGGRPAGLVSDLVAGSRGRCDLLPASYDSGLHGTGYVLRGGHRGRPGRGQGVQRDKQRARDIEPHSGWRHGRPHGDRGGRAAHRDDREQDLGGRNDPQPGNDELGCLPGRALPVDGPGHHDRGDRRVGTCSVPSLAAGAAVPCSRNVTIPASMAPGTYYVGGFADDQRARAESDETNNALAASNPTDLAAALPDLVVTDVTAPLTGTIGSSIQITSTTENRGGTAAGGFRVGLYLSVDPVITAADQLVGTCSVSTLAVGGSIACDRTPVIPSTLAPGVYYVGAFADDQIAVAELDETNNALAASNTIDLTATPTDLTVASVGAPATGTIGSTMQITSKMENLGGTAAGAFRTGLYLSDDATITAADQLIGSCSETSLAGGGTVGCDVDATIPPSVTPGTYYVGAFTDDQGAVVESDETNNTLAASNTTVVATPADLVVTVAGGPATGTIGSNIQITSTTENTGGTAAGAFRVGLYLSVDATITTADELLGSCSMSSLAVGGTAACDADVTIPGSVTPGAYWVGAFADDQDVVTESDETNNALAASTPTVVATPPDLVVADVTAPLTGTIGKRIQITSTTENAGGTEAVGFLVGLYLSTDATITTADQLLGSCFVSSLTDGSTVACDMNATIPFGVTPGAYYVGAIADSQDDVAESDDANNALAASNPTDVTATPVDLEPSDVTAPTTGTIGSTIQIRSTTVNLGGTDAGAFRIGLYLSADATITTADQLLAWCPKSSLAAGTAVDCSSPTVPIPTSVVPGTYYIGVIADDRHDLAESDETNNALTASNTTVLN